MVPLIFSMSSSMIYPHLYRKYKNKLKTIPLPLGTIQTKYE